MPPDRTRARYDVPLGRCTAVTEASASGAPDDVSVTKPVSCAVVTPCAVSVEGASQLARATKTNVETVERSRQVPARRDIATSEGRGARLSYRAL